MAIFESVFGGIFEPLYEPFSISADSPLLDDLPADIAAWWLKSALFQNGEQGGYWPADPLYMTEQSDGTGAAAVSGVIGRYINAITRQPNGLQSTTKNKPYLRQTPQTGKYWLDGNTGTAAMTVTFPSSLGSACTIARVTPDGVTFLENQTIASTYNLTPPYGYNSDVLIINRALTPSEKALVEKVLRRNRPQVGAGYTITTSSVFYGDGMVLSSSGDTFVITNNGTGHGYIGNDFPIPSPGSYRIRATGRYASTMDIGNGQMVGLAMGYTYCTTNTISVTIRTNNNVNGAVFYVDTPIYIEAII